MCFSFLFPAGTKIACVVPHTFNQNQFRHTNLSVATKTPDVKSTAPWAKGYFHFRLMRLQVEAPRMNIGTSLVLFTSLSTILAEYCEEYHLFKTYSGRYCTGEGNVNQLTPPHHCRAAYLHSSTCIMAYNYCAVGEIRTRLASLCPEAKSDPIMVFVVFTQRPYRECYEWVPYSVGETAHDFMIYTDDPWLMICRM